MSALDDNALVMEVADLYVGSNSGDVVNVGSLRNVRFKAPQERVEINSDNRGTIRNRARMRGQVEAELLEVGNPAILETIFKGMVSKSAVAGSIVNNYVQVEAANSWAYNTFIPFDFQDADGTSVNIDSVTAGTNGVLVVNVDYHVYQHADGRWGIIIVDSATVTTLNQTITIQFDYTPAASQVLTGGTSQTATNRYVKIIGPSEDNAGTTREIVLEECICQSDLMIGWNDVEQAGDVVPMPVVFKSNKGTTWTYTDEIIES
jgi:hypothetical protein